MHHEKYENNPRPRMGTAKAGRVSSATGKRPTKRLVSRRKSNTRKGYFPNPVDNFKFAPPGKFWVYFTNHQYFADKTFDSEKSAIDFAKSKGFEATIYAANETIGAWSPIGGYRRFKSNPINHMGEKEYYTYAGWKRAVKAIDPNAEFYGDKDIGGAINVGEWDGEKGSIFTPVIRAKQRRAEGKAAAPKSAEPGFYDADGNRLQISSRIKDFRGESAIVNAFEPPHKPGASGYITTNRGRYYASVYGYEWKGPRPRSANPVRQLAKRAGIRFYRKSGNKWFMFAPDSFSAKTKPQAIKLANELARMYKTQIKIVIDK